MGLVSDKIALVTGSGVENGRATAIKFAAEGAKIVGGKALKREIRPSGRIQFNCGPL